VLVQRVGGAQSESEIALQWPPPGGITPCGCHLAGGQGCDLESHTLFFPQETKGPKAFESRMNYPAAVGKLAANAMPNQVHICLLHYLSKSHFCAVTFFKICYKK